MIHKKQWSRRSARVGEHFILLLVVVYSINSICRKKLFFTWTGCESFENKPLSADVPHISPPPPDCCDRAENKGFFFYNYRLHLTWSHQTPPRPEYIQIAFWVCLDEITNAVTRVKCQYCRWKACMCVPLPSNGISGAFQPRAISTGRFMGWNSERNFMANQGQVYMLSKTAFVAKWSERRPWNSSELTCFVCTDLWWCCQSVSSAADWSSCQTQTAWTRRDSLLFYSPSNKWS